MFGSTTNINQEKQISKIASSNEFLLIAGNSNRNLANSIADNLNIKLGNANIQRFNDGEINIKIDENIRGRDIFILQSTCPPVNEHVVELLLMISTCRRAAAKRITAVIPYFGYARQDRRLSGTRVPVSAADVANLLETMGVDRVISCDLHSGQISGFFGPTVPVDNLEASILAIDYFLSLKLKNVVVISPDAGGVYRARKFQEMLRARGCNAGIAMIVKQRADAGKIERVDLVGDVNNTDVIIIDDMIDTAGTLCEAAQTLKTQGANRVFAFATHGLFSGPGMERIDKSVMEQVVVTDSIPLETNKQSSEIWQMHQQKKLSSKVKQITVTPLLAEAIKRCHLKESLDAIYK